MRSEFLSIMRKGATGTVSGKVQIAGGGVVKVRVKLDRAVSARDGEELAAQLERSGEGKYTYVEFEEGEGRASNAGTARGEQLGYAVRAAFGRVRDRLIPDDTGEPLASGTALSDADASRAAFAENVRIRSLFLRTPDTDATALDKLSDAFFERVNSREVMTLADIRSDADSVLSEFTGE